MAKRLLMCIVAVVGIIALVLTGCAGGGPQRERISVKVLIRTEDERLDIGDHVANVLSELGFDVQRVYGTSRVIAYWMLDDPNDGTWNVYTGGWVNTAVPRDEATNFGFFYTPLASFMGPLWASYTPSEEFMDVAEKLWTGDFANMAEREALFREALPLSMEDSVRIWLCDRNSFSPLRKNVHLAADLAGGIYASRLWAHTIHFRNEDGVPQVPTGNTQMRIATAGDILRFPWNPIAGSNWVYDQFPIRATMDDAFEYDTRDGLVWPHRAVKAEVTVLNTLPVVDVHEGHESWLTLNRVANPIPVPATAWADWDATTQQWIPAGSGKTALTKTVVYYPEGTFGLPLHDGSSLDEGDFLLHAAIIFDRGKPESDIYDEDYEIELETFLQHFKGVEFDFDEEGYDLVVTTYDDLWLLDPELIAMGNTWYPSSSLSGALGPLVWHNLALAMLAEADGKTAFNRYKALGIEGCEWLSFISGPSLDRLQSYLTKVLNPGDPLYCYIPYRNVLDPYITQAEALARYNNLQAWKTARGHFWVGGGPFYLYLADTRNNICELRKFAVYPDDGDMWFFMMNPQPTTPPEHTGAWVDQITITEQPPAQAVAMLGTGVLDVYAFSLIDPDLKIIVEANPQLWYYQSRGSFNEITLNPAGPVFTGTGKFNPFAIPAVREALNKAINREADIVSECMGGNAFPRYTCISSPETGFVESLRYQYFIEDIEEEYAYDFEAADAAIEAALTAIPGVERDPDGKYYYTPPSP